MADSLSMAMLVLLESLSPEQRAVLLLRDVFDYGYDEIAGSSARARTTSASSRAARAATSRTGRPRFQTSREQRDELARRFFAAAQEGDLGGLEALLAHDVVLTGDGGGKVPALARSLHGRSRVARTLLNWVKLGARIPGASMRPVEVNGGARSAAARRRGPAARRLGARDRRRPDPAASARSSTPRSSRTWDRSRTSAHCLRPNGGNNVGVPDYSPQLRENDVDADPVAQFADWFEQAVHVGVHQPEAAALATATPDGAPSVRMVLVKKYGEHGLVFFSNYESRKGGELAANPRAALLFHWGSSGDRSESKDRWSAPAPRSRPPTCEAGRAAAS